MTMNLMQLASQAQAARRSMRVPGLPAVSGQRSPLSGSTTTNLTVPDDVASVSNQPSMKLKRTDDGGIVTVMEHRTRYPNLMDERDLAGLKRLAAQAVTQMVNQSQGGLSTRQLRRMGHPYGRNERGHMRGKLGRRGNVKGSRGAVHNLSIVNRRSGEFARSWFSDVQLNPFGATVTIGNSAPHAGYVGMGTQRMQAHGPNTSVPTTMRSQFIAEWRKQVNQAYRRKAIEAQAARMFGGQI